jgi:hypothetical protein
MATLHDGHFSEHRFHCPHKNLFCDSPAANFLPMWAPVVNGEKAVSREEQCDEASLIR